MKKKAEVQALCKVKRHLNTSPGPICTLPQTQEVVPWTRYMFKFCSSIPTVFKFPYSQGKPMESTSHQLLIGVDKNPPDRLSVAPNAYPSTKMHNPSTDLTRKSSDGSIVLDDAVSHHAPGMCCLQRLISLCSP